jgi:hypothetical protein
MLNHNRQRRALLRGVVAAGCVLSVPMVTGCKPKEPGAKPAQSSSDSSTGMSGSQSSSAPDNAGQPMNQAAGPKVSKAQAKYQDQPKGDQMCGNCTNFIAPKGCKLVEGDVSAKGWCTLWARKQA